MGWMDSLASTALGAVSGQAPAGGMALAAMAQVASELVNKAGGLPGLVAQLQAGGLADAVSSWVSQGANLPITGDQLQQALGPDVLAGLAQSLGAKAPDLANGLASVLPGWIDQLTPQGELPTDGGAHGLSALLGAQGGDVVGMLGGLLKR